MATLTLDQAREQAGLTRGDKLFPRVGAAYRTSPGADGGVLRDALVTPTNRVKSNGVSKASKGIVSINLTALVDELVDSGAFRSVAIGDTNVRISVAKSNKGEIVDHYMRQARSGWTLAIRKLNADSDVTFGTASVTDVDGNVSLLIGPKDEVVAASERMAAKVARAEAKAAAAEDADTDS